MSVNVYIAATLRGFADRNNTIEGSGNSVLSVLESVRDEYPELGSVLFDESGIIRDFIAVFHNDTEVLGDFSKTVKDGDTLTLIPAIAGGSGEKEYLISDERRKSVSLDDAEIDRYNRHLMLRDVGVKGQKRIKASKVLIIGLGALGSPVAEYLAASGVGTIGIADTSKVTTGDLHCQILHSTRDVKRPKSASARDKIKQINPLVKINVIDEEIGPDNILDVISGYDVVADCTDNYRSRYIISDACAALGIPEVYASIYQFEGQVSVLNGSSGPCLRCLYPAPPPGGLVPTCAEGGTLSPLSGVAGSLQAAEILKLIIGGGQSLSGRILYFDLWNNAGRVLRIRKRETCPVCGSNRGIIDVSDYDYDEFCGLKEVEGEIPVNVIEADELAKRIERGDDITIVEVREPHERAIHRFNKAVVIPIGQLARRQKELDPTKDTVFICREGKRSILAINTLREAGYTGPMYSLKGGIEATKNIIFSNEGAWL